MANAAKKLNLKVKTELEFTAMAATFQPSKQLDFLDLDKLASRRARIEVGEFDGGCCATKVYALVERGQVSRIEFSKCKEAGKPPAFLADVLNKAVEATGLNRPSNVARMALPDFIRSARLRFLDIDIGGGCITVCWGDFCFFCCVLDGTTLCGKPIIVRG